MTTDRQTLRATLSAKDFPAAKEDLVTYAESTGADEGTVRALRAMPPAEYANVGEVERSVRFDKAAEEGQSDSDKAKQDRQNTGDRLAEHETRAPENPIVEELGENRGS